MKTQRLPNLAEVAIAILEAKLENLIGSEAINQIKAPYKNKQLEKELLSIVKRAELRIIEKYSKDDISLALKDFPIHDLPSMKEVILKFYNTPTTSETEKKLTKQISEVLPKDYWTENNALIVTDYIKFIWEEATNIPSLREKLKAISVLRIENKAETIEKILDSINQKLASQLDIQNSQKLSRLQLNKVNDIFWLGHDLRWAIAAFKSSKFIEAQQSLERAEIHAKELGFDQYHGDITVSALRQKWSEGTELYGEKEPPTLVEYLGSLRESIAFMNTLASKHDKTVKRKLEQETKLLQTKIEDDIHHAIHFIDNCFTEQKS